MLHGASQRPVCELSYCFIRGYWKLQAAALQCACMATDEYVSTQINRFEAHLWFFMQPTHLQSGTCIQ